MKFIIGFLFVAFLSFFVGYGIYFGISWKQNGYDKDMANSWIRVSFGLLFIVGFLLKIYHRNFE